MRDADDVFMDMVDALGSIENETERDALAMQIFGKSARELNPLIRAGSKALADYSKEAEELGIPSTFPRHSLHFCQLSAWLCVRPQCSPHPLGRAIQTPSHSLVPPGQGAFGVA